ncbi:winged helix-turn-helix transcriptional regulator [Streptomyces sp. So13.3]|uniref:GntR family transcriptional regulator n=1 Tax=Streptomyces sp. So13.3 TaxID=2136173 RepID=UPI001105E87B|nr:winged helix-turn-helix domain-containing protein [Streptomyces sp. So13.3]QNA74189.1 winged helix-turn-helix transcriptional regulator [Streptomyces sp. So13.3]
MTIAKDGPRLRSVQVADELRKELDAGKYVPGKKMPSIKDLAERFDVAEETVKKGLATLREERRIFSVPNRGHFVVDPDSEAGEATAGREDVLELISALRSEVRELNTRVAQLEERIDSGDA